MPRVGTARRLRALACIGYSVAELADQLGCSTDRIDDLRRGRYSTILTTQAMTVARLYEQLSGWPLFGEHADRTRRNALRRGWSSPMAWEGLDIDDPTQRPDHGAADDPAETAWLAALHTGALPAPLQPRADVDRGSCAAVRCRRHGTVRAAFRGCTCADTTEAVRRAGIEEAVAVYLSTVSGWSQTAIAEYLGVHPRQVQRRLRAARGAGWQPDRDDDVPLAVTDPGLTQASARAAFTSRTTAACRPAA